MSRTWFRPAARPIFGFSRSNSHSSPCHKKPPQSAQKARKPGQVASVFRFAACFRSAATAPGFSPEVTLPRGKNLPPFALCAAAGGSVSLLPVQLGESLGKGAAALADTGQRLRLALSARGPLCAAGQACPLTSGILFLGKTPQRPRRVLTGKTIPPSFSPQTTRYCSTWNIFAAQTAKYRNQKLAGIKNINPRKAAGV